MSRPLLALFLIAPTTVFAQATEEAELAAGGLVAFLMPFLIGALIGWIASLIAKGSGSGFLGNLLLGIGGSIVGTYLLPAIGLPLVGLVGGFISAVVGAILLLVIVGLIRKAAS
ncbi:MAG: GlsB/YeaQ/YmgE family stress response membrane protein [Pseudomonadota bacterium]